MGGFSPIHIAIVLFVALIVLGPTELPKAARSGAKLLRELRALRARLDEEVRTLIDDSSIDDEQPAIGSPEGPTDEQPDPKPPDDHASQ